MRSAREDRRRLHVAVRFTEERPLTGPFFFFGGFHGRLFRSGRNARPSTTVALHLAEWLGHLNELRDLERRYAMGEITNQVVAESIAGQYRGVAIADVWEQLASLPLIPGLEQTLEWLRDRSIHVILATVSFAFAAEYLCERFGFESYCGCRMAVDADGRLTGSAAQHIEAEDKTHFVRSFCQARGLHLSDAVAVGDSLSDIPLFRAVGLAVALNGTPEAEQTAHVAIRATDLRELIPIIEERARLR